MKNLRRRFERNNNKLNTAVVLVACALIALAMIVFTPPTEESSVPLIKVVIPEGLRKEQIAEILSKELSWTYEQKLKWITTYTAMEFDYVEGVYFPDTYLIPVNESPLTVARRLRSNFETKLQPYIQAALDQNIKWTTLVSLASIVQREAANETDMPLVAGILWNRLRNDLKLDVDATIQYARDTELNYPNNPCKDLQSELSVRGLCDKNVYILTRAQYVGGYDWWSPIKLEDKEIDSPYNTYLYEGLPPRPISNPGITALRAALYPAVTECLYYLHDETGDIHCSKTLEQHRNNIEKYLR